MKKLSNKQKKKLEKENVESSQSWWDSLSGATKKIIATALVIFAVIQGLIGLDSYINKFATVSDVQAWDKNLETNLVAQLQQFKDQNQQDWLLRRSVDLNDQMFKTKLLMKQYPKDKDLQDDYKSLQDKKDGVDKQIDNSNKKLKQLQ